MPRLARVRPTSPGGVCPGLDLEALQRFGKGPRVLLIYGPEFYSYTEGRPPPHCMIKEAKAPAGKGEPFEQAQAL